MNKRQNPIEQANTQLETILGRNLTNEEQFMTDMITTASVDPYIDISDLISVIPIDMSGLSDIEVAVHMMLYLIDLNDQTANVAMLLDIASRVMIALNSTGNTNI